MENTTLLMNIIWTMLGAFLVYFMQAGFAMVETGFTRAKNAGTVSYTHLFMASPLATAFLNSSWVCSRLLISSSVIL